MHRWHNVFMIIYLESNIRIFVALSFSSFFLFWNSFHKMRMMVRNLIWIMSIRSIFRMLLTRVPSKRSVLKCWRKCYIYIAYVMLGIKACNIVKMVSMAIRIKSRLWESVWMNITHFIISISFRLGRITLSRERWF